MFSRREGSGGGKMPKPGAPGLSFIGAEVAINGDIKTKAQLHVDGRVDGNVGCGQLCLGESGIVTGNIESDEARISGLVEGMVTARTLTLEATARIQGDISYETISIAAGAQVDGRLARQSALVEVPSVIVATPITERRPTTIGKADSGEPEVTGDKSQDFFHLSAPRKAAG